MAVTFASMGLTDLVLDPGTAPNGKMLQQTLLNFINLRRAAVEEAQRDIAYPVMVLPINAWLTSDDPVRASYWESVLTAAFVIRGGAIDDQALSRAQQHDGGYASALQHLHRS